MFRKHEICVEFNNIAKNYINIRPIEERRQNIQCNNCDVDMLMDDDYLYVCPKCGFSRKHYVSVASYQENNRINSAQRYVYDKRGHFIDSMKKFQGKQNTTIPKKVYDTIYAKINNHGISIEEFTKTHLYEFLKASSNSDYYEDMTLIWCEITKNTPPDISYLEQTLLMLFDQIDPIYEKIKPQDKINFMNGQYVLFKLLQLLKFPCKEEDFYILKTRDKLLEHDDLWKKICNELSWTFIATV